MEPSNPLIVQSDSTLLLEVDNPLFKDARNAVNAFAHLEKSPEHVHTYVITPLSLWNAASLGWNSDRVVEVLDQFSRYPLPVNVVTEVHEQMGRFGKLLLENDGDGRLMLRCTENGLLARLSRNPKIADFMGPVEGCDVPIATEERGRLKQALVALGFPVNDRAGYVDGEPFSVSLREVCRDGSRFHVREYQQMAAEGFMGNAEMPGGSGVVVLPCGAGKTIVGLVAMAVLERKCLILVTSVTAARQWKREIMNRTNVGEEDIGEYSGDAKEIRPITVATYQILTYRRKKTAPFAHYAIFNKENWGLIIYDEVHLLPAPVFKFTAEIQARRRLGLTATLVREDGHEQDVFALIGPKKFDVPWKVLEKQGWIATARCVEIRVDLPDAEKMQYLTLSPKQQIRLAYENPRKEVVVGEILREHRADRVLILAQYLSQVDSLGREFEAPIITGATPSRRRDELYDRFRAGEIKILVLSKVGNFAVDLPDANVAIQVSGAFGSRQEEAQRLGRILRPKKNGEQALFYSVVTRESREIGFAMKRQLFLAEQGYSYEIQYREFD